MQTLTKKIKKICLLIKYKNSLITIKTNNTNETLQCEKGLRQKSRRMNLRPSLVLYFA
jgi:hypothetical protein